MTQAQSPETHDHELVRNDFLEEALSLLPDAKVEELYDAYPCVHVHDEDYVYVIGEPE